MIIPNKHANGNEKLTDHNRTKEAAIGSAIDHAVADGLRKNRKHEDSNQNQLGQYNE